MYIICMYIHMYAYCIYVTPKKFEWHFSDQLTFSNARGRLLVEFIDELYHCVCYRNAFLVELIKDFLI